MNLSSIAYWLSETTSKILRSRNTNSNLKLIQFNDSQKPDQIISFFLKILVQISVYNDYAQYIN